MFAGISASKANRLSVNSRPGDVRDWSAARFDPQSLNHCDVRHSGVSEGFAPVLVPFSELPKMSDSCDLDQLLMHIKTGLASSEWLAVFNAVTNLRALFSNMTDRVDQIMNCFFDDLIRCLASHKSATVKNALLAFVDFYSHSRQHQIPFEHTTRLLALLIGRALVPNRLSRELVDQTLVAIIRNNSCDSLLQQLCELSTNANFKVGAVAFHYLAIALNNLREEVSGFRTETTQMIFQTVAFVLDRHPSGNHRLVARNIARFYKDRMGENGFREFLRFAFANQALSKQAVEAVWGAARKEDKPDYPRLSLQVSLWRKSLSASARH